MVEKKVNEILKSKGITKVTTPRVGHEIAKTRKQEEVDFGFDLLQKAKAGKITQADMNREIKGFINKSYNKAMDEFFDTHRKKEAI